MICKKLREDVKMEISKKLFLEYLNSEGYNCISYEDKIRRFFGKPMDSKMKCFN